MKEYSPNAASTTHIQQLEPWQATSHKLTLHRRSPECQLVMGRESTYRKRQTDLPKGSDQL